ncbi:MAG: hypothetical protein ACOYEP_07990 [Limnochordia bacterium]|jgi:hypothetical protein
MGMYLPSTINERALEQARWDAMAAYAPQWAVITSGFLAGFVAAWLPGIIALPLLFLYRWAFGVQPWMTGEEKLAAALADLSKNTSAYAKIAILVAIGLGLYGIVQALLRQRSAVTNRYKTMEFSKYGEVRIGADGKLTILAFPVVTLIGLALADKLAVLYVALVIVVLSGFFYHILWTKLDNLMLTILYRRRYEDRVADAMRLLIPRHCGWDICVIHDVEVDRTEKSIRVEGEFETDHSEREAREVVAHFMRGYHPIYLINTKRQ